MVSKKVKVNIPTGIHLRPAGQLSETALKFKSKITIIKKNDYINAKSLLSILGACIKYGDEVEFICEGPDEMEALGEVIAVVQSEFE